MDMAQLGEQEFALAALPGYAHGTAFGALARLATESAPGGVEPTRDSVEVTRAERDQRCAPAVTILTLALPNAVCRRAWQRPALG
jgi:hypothetical protein